MEREYTHKELADIIKERGLDMKVGTVQSRLKRGTMTLEEALTTPVMSAKEAGRKGGQYSSWQRSFK
jgi:DNA-directed RNA polymerase specialized sigma24 family protein